jgi:hypothetical protein
MSSPSDYEPDTETADGSAQLREQTAAMLRKLADTYSGDADSAQANAEQLRTEAQAQDARARQLSAEATRLKAEADRLSNPPSWESGEEQPDPDPTGPASTGPGSEGSGSTESGPEPARGYAGSGSSPSSAATSDPEAAAGTSSETSAGHPSVIPGSSDTATGVTGPGGTDTGSNVSGSAPDSDDWAPRPFESWRNQAGQVSPRFLEL